MKLAPIKGKGNENLYRNPKNQMIYFKIFRKGKGEMCRSCKTTVLAEARIIADDLRMQFLGVQKIKRGKKFCGELFPELIKRKEISLRPRSIISMKGSWNNLKPYIEFMLPEDVTANWWESVYVPGKRKDAPNRKFFNDRKWLRMFLLSLKRDGVLQIVPTLILPDVPTKVGKVYSDEEIKKFLDQANLDLELQILMAVTMGMRVGEIMGMTWDRINMTNRTIHLRAQDTKTKQARTFGISQSVWNRLSCLRPGGPLFPSPNDDSKTLGPQGNKTSWRSCKRRAGVSGRFHDLRHTFLTKAFKTSTNPALICHYAGLSLEIANRVYLHFDTDDTREVSGLVRFG